MSNISIVYGYGFDAETNDGYRQLDLRSLDVLGDDHTILPDGMLVLTGYSITAYNPTGFVIGVPVMQDISMFYPTAVENTLTPAQQKLVDDWVIPEWLRPYAVGSIKPKFLIFGFTDD